MNTKEKLVGKFLILEILNAKELSEAAGYELTCKGFNVPITISYGAAENIVKEQDANKESS